jgi:hypothetical protein
MELAMVYTAFLVFAIVFGTFLSIKANQQQKGTLTA